eukprot:GSChrysophyteH2.ASY1.ANO1.712.1 assembled CDS
MSDAAKVAAERQRREDSARRQAGDLPPEKDEATGKMINPHNPDFITKVPWYLGEKDGPTLQHQNQQIKTDKATHELTLTEIDALYAQKTSKQKALKAKASQERVVTYRKGACKNCGAMTHKERDCVERPRSKKKSAWKTGLNIAADEASLALEQHGKVSFEGKRDAWQGYDPEEYKQTIKKFNRVEAQRRRKDRERVRAERRLASGTGTGNAEDTDSSMGSESSEDEGDEGADGNRKLLAGTNAEWKAGDMMVTARNLRIREDRPKYLLNLDMNSAHYDPKARSMRANPNPHLADDETNFAGDNFAKHSGDAVALAAQQVLCWEMQAKGAQVDGISNPSQMELVAREFKEKKATLDAAKKQAISDKYGNAAANTASSTSANDGKAGGKSAISDKRLRLGQSEAYQEYSRDGPPSSAAAEAPVSKGKSKYAEDVYEHNHTEVWGSYYNRRSDEWGYNCCWQCLRSSFCTGNAGKMAIRASQTMGLNTAAKSTQAQPKATTAAPAASSSKGGATSSAAGSATFVRRSDVFGDAAASLTLDPEKMKNALARAEQHQNEGKAGKAGDVLRSGGLGGSTSGNGEVSVEDMEVFRMKRQKGEDPMAALLDSDKVLDY